MAAKSQRPDDCIGTTLGDKSMTRSSGNYNPRTTEQFETIMQAIEEALYYPSLKDGNWDDELLPSGD